MRRIIALLVVAAVTVGAWAAWLSWESGYTTAADGSVSGPYSVWQVAGCVVTLIVIAAVAGRRLHPAAVIPTMTVAFTAAWSYDAANSDDSGLWPVGAFLVAVGTAAGTAVVATAARFLGRRGAS